MTNETNELKILLVSPDLMSTSRIAALARPVPASVETLRSLDDEPRGGPFDLILLDLQALAGDPAVLVSRVAAINEKQRAQTDKSAKLVAFGPHVAKERLAESVAAGADAAVSRGELLGGFHGLVKRWLA